MPECMLCARDLLAQMALVNGSFLLSDDWFAVQELTECLKPVYGMITAIHLKKLTAAEFFDKWLKCKSLTAAQECEQCFFFGIGNASCHGT